MSDKAKAEAIHAAAAERNRREHVAACKQLGLDRQAVNAMTPAEVRDAVSGGR